MWKMVWILFFYWFLIPEVQAQSQHVNKKALGYFQRAKTAFREREEEKALELLQKAKSMDQGFSGVYLLEADIYHSLGDRIKERKSIEMALALDSLKNHPYYFFILAEDYFERADYSKALEYYRLYLERDKRQQVSGQVLQQVKNCRFALEAMRTQVKKNAEVFYEAERPVYWPALDVTAQTLLFTEQNGDQEAMGMWKEGKCYPLNFNGTGNYGAPSLTADGQMMFFSMETAKNGFDIYVAYRLTDTTWSEPINLGYPINTDSWDAQPAVSADGTRLYFASTREGGRGGSDIWFSRLIRREPNGKQVWSQPRCLYFNTNKDEMAPFLYFDNKTLFFASNGYPGMGRKDIYKVDVEMVTQPLNIGITVNTQKDEFGFLVDGSGQWGYFSSDISGKRCIYRYRLESQIACPPAVYVKIVTKNEHGVPLAPDFLTLVDVETGDTLAYYDELYGQTQLLACVPANKLLLVNAIKKGYLYYSDTLQIKTALEGKSQEYSICLKSIGKGRSFILKGIFFDVDDYQLKSESYHELQQLVTFLRLNPEVRIEVSGHTDSSGDDEYNYRLSENRAFEVYKFLFLKHIAKERMDYKGYGKDRPLAPNDTETGKAQNRRTEIRIR